MELDWRQIDQAVIRKEWPEAPLPPKPRAVGFRRALKLDATGVGCCCTTGREAATPIFEAPSAGDATLVSNRPGLWAINAMLCRPSTEQAIDALKKLAGAVVPAQTYSTYAENWDGRATGAAHYSAAWDTAKERFILEINAEQQGQWWIGWLMLGRRPPVETRETWTLANGFEVRVLGLDVRQSGRSARKSLELVYLSDCLNRDTACWSKEIVGLWPRVRTTAERDGAAVISIRVENGVGRSTGVHMMLAPNGTWSWPSFLKL